jgi:hypothetical protein
VSARISIFVKMRRAGTAAFCVAGALFALSFLPYGCGPKEVKLPPPGRGERPERPSLSEIKAHAETGFPLEGSHALLSCDACHAEASPSPDCASCHQSPHGKGFKKKCEDCHTAGHPFSEIKFRHPAKDLFAFHRDVPCTGCHKDHRFDKADRNCTSCHDDYHRGSLGRDCYECHRSSTWEVTRFNHNMTGFPLVGAHRALECGDCHRDLQSFVITPRPAGCASCHEKDYRGSTFPHAAYGAGLNCQECHLQDSWTYAHSPAWFNVQTGQHAGVPCATCHANADNYLEYSCHACHAGHEGDRGGRCLDCHPGHFPGGKPN